MENEVIQNAPLQKVGADGLQHFKLYLSCEHPHPGHMEHAVMEYDNQPYVPNYLGREYVCRVCDEKVKIVRQEAM